MPYQNGRHLCAWHFHDDVIKMEQFSALLTICAGNSPAPVNSPHKGQWRGALMFPLICVWINDWVNNREAGDLRRYRAHNDVTVMLNAFSSIKKFGEFRLQFHWRLFLRVHQTIGSHRNHSKNEFISIRNWKMVKLHGPLTRYVKLRVMHAPGINAGNVFPATDFKGKR